MYLENLGASSFHSMGMTPPKSESAQNAATAKAYLHHSTLTRIRLTSASARKGKAEHYGPVKGVDGDVLLRALQKIQNVWLGQSPFAERKKKCNSDAEKISVFCVVVSPMKHRKAQAAAPPGRTFP